MDLKAVDPTLQIPKIAAEPFVYRYANVDIQITNLGRVDWSLPVNVIQYLKRDHVIPDPENGRTVVLREDIQKLADSIRIEGVHTPLKVRRGPDDQPVLIGGHKRLAGAALAGLEYLPCIIYPSIQTPFQIRKSRVLDNEHRTDMPPIDKAIEYRGLIEDSKREGRELTVPQLAAQMNLSDATIYQYLNLLKLPKAIQTSVNSLRIPLYFAHNLLTIKLGTSQETEKMQIEIATQFLAGKIKAIPSMGGRSNRPKVPGAHSPKAPVFQRSIALDDATVVIGSKTPLTDQQVAEALQQALGRLAIPIHGNEFE